MFPYDYARVPAAPVLALGAAGAVPGSLGVVQGDGQKGTVNPEAAIIVNEIKFPEFIEKVYAGNAA